MNAPPSPTGSAGNVRDARVALNNGLEMPWLGLGVWQVKDNAETERVVRSAIEQGYRSIDTARIYGNERGIGRAIRSSGLPREQLFITSKVWNDDVRRNRVAAAFDETLDLLGLEYLDLYLVHWPVSGHVVAAWRAMEQIAASGRVRAIGVSNHMRVHLDELLAIAQTIPAVNQIEFHPYLQSRELVEFCRQNRIQVEAWSPLMRAGALFEDPVLLDIARRHGKTVAQVVLRWDIQSGIITIPKSVRPQRIAENAAVFDFALTPDEMNAINRVDRNQRVGPAPFNFSF